MIAVFAILRIYPFGGNTVMTGDTTYQLVDYLSYYKTILLGNNDFAYSLSKNMGGEMSGFAAYYLFSPLNLMTIPFTKEYLFVGIGLIIIIVPGLASLSMCYLLKNLNYTNDSVLLFSFCYGLSAYIIVYNELLYYYTNIILLPLIFLFLRKIDKRKQCLCPGYIIFLSLAIMNNYYTGYMICLFLFIYVIFYIFGVNDINGRLNYFIKFVINSVFAVLLSAVTLIPAVMSLSGEKNNLSVGLFITFSPFNYLSKLYSGSFSGDFGAGLPNIYCGVIITVLLAVIIMDKHIAIKKRTGIGIMLLFFWVDFCINTLNVIWHGLNQPIGFPYRQAFVVVFFCIITVFENTDFSRNIEKKVVVIVSAAFVFYSIFAILRKIDNVDYISISVTAAILVFCLIILYIPVKNRLLLLCLLTILDLSFDAFYSMSHFYFTSIDEYQKPLQEISDAIGNVKDDRKDVFRIEKEFRRTNNDAMMMNYAGLTHFSSSEKKKTISFLGKLGFRDNGNWAMYTGINTALADSILGVRYVISQFDSTGKPYTDIYIDDKGKYFIYKNPYAIPILSAVESTVLNVSLGDDPFLNQNAIADAMTGTDNDILSLQNATRKDNPDGSVSFDLNIQNDGMLYCFFSAPELQDAVIFINGEEWTEYFGTYNWSTLNLQERKKGETLHIDLIPKGTEQIVVDEGYFAVIDYDNMIKWSEEVRKQNTFLYKKTSSLYKGYYDSDKDTILFSIPIDEGWHLYVDDIEYELKEACGHMMAACVPDGKHNIELRFNPPGRITGMIISIITLIFITIYCICNKKNIHYLGSKKNI